MCRGYQQVIRYLVEHEGPDEESHHGWFNVRYFACDNAATLASMTTGVCEQFVGSSCFVLTF